MLFILIDDDDYGGYWVSGRYTAVAIGFNILAEMLI